MDTSNQFLTNLAKVGYEAYAASSSWKNFQGNPMPQWDELPQAIRNHWQAATKAISDARTKRVIELYGFTASSLDESIP